MGADKLVDYDGVIEFFVVNRLIKILIDELRYFKIKVIVSFRMKNKNYKLILRIKIL